MIISAYLLGILVGALVSSVYWTARLREAQAAHLSDLYAFKISPDDHVEYITKESKEI